MKMKMLHLLIACLALCSLSHGQRGQNPSGFISIDCGAPSYYFNSDLNVSYSPDAGFVDAGMNMQISTHFIYDNVQQYLKNMRVFPNGTRNCYTLKPDQGKSNKYLIRASFWYGDYDGKNRTPTFDLYIDVNYWYTVNSSGPFYTEIIYVPPRDYIQVCLVNIGLGASFISNIELRPLNNSIYPINSSALVTYRRQNLGSTNIYRHPYDEYDRIWYKDDGIDNLYPSVGSTCGCTTNIVTSTNNDDYKVPPEVLITAEQTRGVNESLSLFWTPSYNSTTTWYVYFHFVELTLQMGQFRELETYVGNKFVKSVILNNSKPVTVVSLPFGGSNPNLTVKATTKSTLPPLLNAVEVFYVQELQYSSTILEDFIAMDEIKRTYKVARDSWEGDPCVPKKYSWSGVNCSYIDFARIISLNLSSTGLEGQIATSLSNLTALVSLDLSNNQLIGSVPDFFAQIPSLKILNLSHNNFSGSIPQALLNKKADGSLQLRLEGNQNLCLSNRCSTKKKSTNVAAIVTGIALGIMLLTAPAVLWRIKKDHNNGISWGNSNGTLRASKNQTFTSSDISKITDNFKTLIGQGGFGKVYFGKLVNGTQVAVKVLSQSSIQGYSTFENEAKILIGLNHKNLVSFIGYCDELGNTALVYEFMPNGNVRQHLSEHSPSILTWNQRVQIAVDAAQGLEYLHNGHKPPIVHRDLKTTNILLNENLQAKIADFGLSKVFTSEHDTHISTRPAGTPGYLDPEFYSSGNLNKKSDVYSFGIILFELITGKPAIIRDETDSTHILQWVIPLIQCGEIQSVVDQRLGGQFDLDSARKLIEIAMSCIPRTAVERSDMSHILLDLKHISREVASQEGRRVEISTSITYDPSEITPR